MGVAAAGNPGRMCNGQLQLAELLGAVGADPWYLRFLQ